MAGPKNTARAALSNPPHGRDNYRWLLRMARNSILASTALRLSGRHDSALRWQVLAWNVRVIAIRLKARPC
jgi:hypothetical protein